MNNHKVLTHTNRIESYKEDIYMKWFDNTALTIVIIGAVNWLLIGIFRLDLIAWLFGKHVMVLTYRLHDRRTVWTLPDQSFW